ncbi:MAG TPA: tRNA(Ile)-lysidine synthetase, partial [Candidatus Gallimonas intestinigallinarum]|nr:tRNA(Ile)-lysidine synthetase [Candidatus Gallimonas intestinigallinarum]
MELIDCKPYALMRVCVALSGGRDSVALLHALKAGGVSVSALTCGHGVRAASEDDIAFVQRLCRDWGV